jgi:hypothetical protein
VTARSKSGPAAAHWLRLRVRIPMRVRICLARVGCQVEILRAEEYIKRGVSECDLKT